MKVAVVTGGSTGIGAGIVRMMVSEGYEVVFCGRNETNGNLIANETKAKYVKCDITDSDQVKQLFTQVK